MNPRGGLNIRAFPAFPQDSRAVRIVITIPDARTASEGEDQCRVVDVDQRNAGQYDWL